MPTQDDSENMVTLTERRVRTPEGASLYGQPIGTVISDDMPGKDSTGKPVTFERLRSILEQYKDAKAVGNKSQMKAIMLKFTKEFQRYSQDESNAKDILGRLREATAQSPTEK